IVGSFHAFGRAVKQSTLNLVEDYLSIGKVGKAISVLKHAYERATKPVVKGAEATAKFAKESEAADHVQRLLAGGVKHAEAAVKRAGEAAGTAAPKVKDLTGKMKDLDKQKPNPKITVDGSQAQTTIQGIREQLETLSGKVYTTEVHVVTTGSPSGFWVLEKLTDALEEVTEKDWQASVG